MSKRERTGPAQPYTATSHPNEASTNKNVGCVIIMMTAKKMVGVVNSDSGAELLHVVL